ncbi:S10 family peptidase [Dyella amyloliquefaciens]|uniref:S10 family peptidase n=1 Tax=Dyella amyloliquefaciens TaxID=1770545 RepID=UPI00197AFEE4|nr:hypothetical protein [Dyella amyloliquefaciens]
MKALMLGAFVACLGVTVSSVRAADAPDSGTQPNVTTHHRGKFNGKAVRYAVEVAPTHVGSGDNGPSADLVSVSYVAEGIKREQDRPVMFVFNGGPITASVYLHMLGLGPRRLVTPSDVNADIPPTPLADNPSSPLDATDLVFFDPAGTGYSRVASGTSPSAYFSVDADAEQFTQFVQAWLKAHGREASPVYLYGESYGTLRAAAAAQKLSHLKTPVQLSGVFLQGQALNIIEISQRHDNIISYTVSLPTLAALGWFHGKVDHTGKTFQQHLDESRDFAQNVYMPALFKGGNLDPKERDAVAAKLEALTGLPASVFLANDLKVSKVQYRALLFKDQNELLSANDGRYKALITKDDPHPDGSEKVMKAAEAAYAKYAKDELGVQTGYVYRSRAGVENMDLWGWGAKSPFGDWPYMAMIKDAMKLKPQLRVVIGQGYFDTLTTTGATDYAVAQSGWPKDRVRVAYYESGHMAYTVQSSLEQMSRDLHELISPTSSATGTTPRAATAP